MSPSSQDQGPTRKEHTLIFKEFWNIVQTRWISIFLQHSNVIFTIIQICKLLLKYNYL